MRPLFMASYGGFGGSEAVLLRIIRALGDEIDANAVIMAGGPLADLVRAEGVRTRVESMPGRWAMARAPFVARRLARRYKDEQLDFIHANGTKAAILGALLAPRIGVPLLWMKHDHGYEGWLTKAVARRCDRVVCVSRTMADMLGPDVQDRVSVIYPGVELSDQPTLGDTPPHIAAAGRLDPAKGYDVLIRALAILVERGYSDARVRIAGLPYPVFPNHGTELRQLANDLGVGDRVEIRAVDDVAAHYRTARVVALTSLPIKGRPAEGASLVLVEALSHGRPGVGPAEGGIGEILGSGGTLVENRTPEGFADALEPYLADSAMADAVGEVGRRQVEELFSEAAMMAGIRRVYGELAGRSVAS